MPDDLQRELDFALELADAADAFTLPRFEQQDFALGWKDDRTEVTEADRGTESLLAERIIAARPDHALFGEEHGTQGAEDAEWCWVIDPIDGTSGFVRGIPVWATLIALTHRERGAMVGVVSAPALGRRWWAAHGLGSFAGGRRCSGRRVGRAGSATSGSTASSPRARSTSPSTPSASSPTTSPP